MIRVEWCFNEQVLLPSLPSQPTLPSQNDHGNFFHPGYYCRLASELGRGSQLQFISTAECNIQPLKSRREKKDSIVKELQNR